MSAVPPKPGLEAPALRLEVDPHMDDALQFLRDNVIEPEDTVELEINVIRNWRHERNTRSFAYWAPSVIGALAAAAALLAVLQLAITPAATQPLPAAIGAPLESNPTIPTYTEPNPGQS